MSSNKLIIYFAVFWMALFIENLYAQADASKINVYFFPGQGSDSRIFKKIELPADHKAVFVSYPVPEKGQSLAEYAMTFVPLIDTTLPFILIGHSLGGMICVELADSLTPLETIIISSAKTRYELPFRYRLQKKLPIYKLIPKRIIKIGALLLQPLVEPDRNNCKDTFKAMLKDKEPIYLKRTIHMIINWDRKSYLQDVIHIHGDNDHTIPIRNVDYDFRVKGGSHMMVLTRSSEINELINRILLY